LTFVGVCASADEFLVKVISSLPEKKSNLEAEFSVQGFIPSGQDYTDVKKPSCRREITPAVIR
jgi:hypothetical protein